MKKIISIISSLIFILLIPTSLLAQSSVFERVKSIALTATINEEGNYFKHIESSEGFFTCGLIPGEGEEIGAGISDGEQSIVVIQKQFEVGVIYVGLTYIGTDLIKKELIDKEFAEIIAESVLTHFEKKV